MDLSRLEDLQVALRLAGVKPNKGLGQHFLVDADSLRQIVAAAELTKQDTVLEIGPGMGVMTGLLAEAAGKVVAVEADRLFSELLADKAPDNLEVISQDILEFDLRTLGQPYKVVANLPYYLTSKILRLLLESPTPPALMSVLIQKEVAERIVAKPGQMSILALSVQYYAEASLENTVGRYKFWPPPKVDSAIIKIKRRPKPAFAADPQLLFRLIKAGFGEKRKQLKNSLAGGLNVSSQTIEEILEQTKLSPLARAQELSLGDWERLYKMAIKRELL